MVLPTGAGAVEEEELAPGVEGALNGAAWGDEPADGGLLNGEDAADLGERVSLNLESAKISWMRAC